MDAQPTGAEPNDENRLGFFVNQRGDVAQHALQTHVVSLSGRLHFSADVKIDLPAR